MPYHLQDMLEIAFLEAKDCVCIVHLGSAIVMPSDVCLWQVCSDFFAYSTSLGYRVYLYLWYMSNGTK